MRGVHPSFRGIACPPWGSSPHARGPLGKAFILIEYRGIIPACAGSTMPDHDVGIPSWDHPRMRGVHNGVGVIIRQIVGSSPHARGPLLVWMPWPVQTGIIPACAGSTLFFLLPSSWL